MLRLYTLHQILTAMKANTNTEYKGNTYTTEQIEAMKDWAKDCIWSDLDSEEIDELSNTVILRGVDRHYCGGLASFVVDCIPVYIG